MRVRSLALISILIGLSLTCATLLAWVVDDYAYDKDEGAGGGAEAYVHGWSNTYDYYQHLSFGGRTWYNAGARLLGSGREHRAKPPQYPTEAWSHYWIKVQILWLPWFPTVVYDALAYIHI